MGSKLGEEAEKKKGRKVRGEKVKKGIIQQEEQEINDGRCIRVPALSSSSRCFVAFVSSPASRLHDPTLFRKRWGRSAPYYREEPGGPLVTRLLPRYHTMAEIRPIQPKISNKSIANDRHGVSCVCFLFSKRLPGPNLELKSKKRLELEGESHSRIWEERRTKESQDPVHRLIPSLLTPRQLTRLS